MIYCYGADPFDSSPSSTALHKQMKEAGFKMSAIKVVKTPKDLPDDCHVLCFGATAFKQLTGCEEGLGNNRGQLFHADRRTSVLVFPTFAPGYLYRNPDAKWVFKDDLSLFCSFISFDQGI